MKILVLSDSHGHIDKLGDRLRGFDVCVHLGDNGADVADIERRMPNVRFLCVRGNCDRVGGYPIKDVVEVAGKKVLVTHGHMYSVKSALTGIISEAKTLGVDCCMFGHTHISAIFEEDGILFINPGSYTFPDDGCRVSFAVINVDGDMDWNVNIVRE